MKWKVSSISLRNSVYERLTELSKVIVPGIILSRGMTLDKLINDRWNKEYNHKYTRIFGLKETDELKNTVYDGDLWRIYRDRQNAMARARRKARKNEVE